MIYYEKVKNFFRKRRQKKSFFIGMKDTFIKSGFISNYTLIKQNSTFCSKCNGNVDLLSTKEMKAPAFYICFNCQTVGQVGEGIVLREDSVDV